MSTPSASFEPISYDPANPQAQGRRLTFSERSLHRLKPYARTSSTSGSVASESLASDNGSGQKKTKKLALCDLPESDRPAVRWTRRRLVMDLLTTVVWPQNESEKEKDIYLKEILNQANSMFKTNLVLTKELAALMNSAVTQFRSSLVEISEELGREFDIEPEDSSLTDVLQNQNSNSPKTRMPNKLMRKTDTGRVS
ncbi:hypothetical protein P692DRAFT_201809696 [Suillus brevipes Sb2]|nr:hypothetical protein P692DRAFT_201809696 [Suillus brevipes Sb2]